MTEIKKRLALYRLPDPETLFPFIKSVEWCQYECCMGTYYLNDESAAEVYQVYGKELAKAGFMLRCSTDHASVWIKNSQMIVMEHNGEDNDSVFRLSFVRLPKQEKIDILSDFKKIFRNDFKKNSKWIQINKLKPYFILLSYRGVDFSGKAFRRELIRFADFFRCDFKNTSWHACRFNLSVDGGKLFCYFYNCDFSGSKFVGVDFSRCIFVNCNFTDCCFKNCRLEHTVMENCPLEDFEMIRCHTDTLYFYCTGECESDD